MHYIIEEIDEDTSMEDLQKMMVVALIYRLLVCFYEIICIWGAGGATPGKFLLGLRVVTCDTSVLIAPSRVLVIPSSNVSITTSTIRALIKNFSIASFFPAFITLLFFQHNRTAYDIVAGTIVVKRNGVRWCPRKPWIPLFGIMTRLNYVSRPSVSLGKIDLEIKAVTSVWYRWLFWKYWFYLNAKELFQKKNIVNSSVKKFLDQQGQWFHNQQRTIYTFFRSKALEFVKSIFSFEISKWNFKIFILVYPKMMEEVQLCFVNTYLVYLSVNTSWGNGSLFGCGKGVRTQIGSSLTSLASRCWVSCSVFERGKWGRPSSSLPEVSSLCCSSLQ